MLFRSRSANRLSLAVRLGKRHPPSAANAGYMTSRSYSSPELQRCSKVFSGRGNRDLVNRTRRISPEFSYDPSRGSPHESVRRGRRRGTGWPHPGNLRFDRECRVLSTGVALARLRNSRLGKTLLYDGCDSTALCFTGIVESPVAMIRQHAAAVPAEG